jgi:hypothetical protein
MKDKRAQIYIATALAIAFIAFFVAYGVNSCSTADDPKAIFNKEQTIENNENQNQNESLFIGCNGFF